MKTKDMIHHYNQAGASCNPYQIVRHGWTQHDFETKNEETVLNLFDFNLSKNDTFLDLGCGLGLTARLTQNKVKHYFGVDASIGLLNRSYRGEGISYVLNNGKSIPADDDSIDVLISEQMLQHVLECEDGFEVFESYLEEIIRVVKEDGRYCIQIPKLGPYKHGVGKEILLKYFAPSQIIEMDNWYWHVIKGIKRNSIPMWLNNGKFKKRDLELFGDNYIDYE